MSVKRAALWSIVGNYTSFAIQFATSVIISRFFLQPDEVGLFSVAMAASMLLAVLQDFGINRYIVAHKEVDERLIAACLTFSWILSLIVGLVLAIAAVPLAHFYDNMSLVPVILVIALGYIVNAASVVPNALLIKALDFRSVSMITIVGAGANAVVSIALAAKGYSVMSLAWGLAASAIVRSIFAYVLQPYPLRFSRDIALLKGVFSFGSINTLLAISGAIGVRSTDLVIGRLLGMSATGLFSRASGLTVQLHTLLLGAVSNVFFPAFAQLEKDGQPLAPNYMRVVALYGAIVWPAMVLLSLLATPLIELLYGPRWSAAAPILSILALSEIIFVMLPLQMEIPILKGRIRQLLKLNIAETCLSVALLAIFAKWGIVAAAWSRIAYACCWYIIYSGLMHRLIGFHWKDMLSLYMRSMGLALITAAPLFGLYATITSPAQISLLMVFLAIIMAGVFWAAGLFLLRHPARKDLTGLFSDAVMRLRSASNPR